MKHAVITILEPLDQQEFEKLTEALKKADVSALIISGTMWAPSANEKVQVKEYKPAEKSMPSTEELSNRFPRAFRKPDEDLPSTGVNK